MAYDLQGHAFKNIFPEELKKEKTTNGKTTTMNMSQLH